MPRPPPEHTRQRLPSQRVARPNSGLRGGVVPSASTPPAMRRCTGRRQRHPVGAALAPLSAAALAEDGDALSRPSRGGKPCGPASREPSCSPGHGGLLGERTPARQPVRASVAPATHTRHASGLGHDRAASAPLVCRRASRYWTVRA
jgi:hypothetical protein